MSKSRSISAVLALGFVLSVITGGYAVAAADTKAVPTFGVVDVAKVFDGYDKKKTASQEFAAEGQKLQEKLQLRQINRMLSNGEFDQFMELKTKVSLNDNDKKKMDDLLATTKSREQELQTLQQKQNSTDAEKVRLNELQDMANKGEDATKLEAEKLQAQFAQKQDDMTQKLLGDIEKAVAAVAKDKGLAMVLNKNVNGAPFVLFATVDVTDEVLNKLNKK